MVKNIETNNEEVEAEGGSSNGMDEVTYENGFPVYQPIVVPPPPEKVSAFDQNGPRLVVTHITNENFKSYAGVQSLGPFHKSLSCIVGPNGSGKSNVIDSMLFVFGYRANKIRSKKISVLIHNSEKHQNVNSCTVAVHFQKIIDTGTGENDFTVVPNSQFVVSRTAFKDNSSYYKINDRKAQYKEVATLLRGNGIDLDHNRFLILQGEVEQIATMKPKALTEHEDGMLEFLEDIIGSSRFKNPIELLAKRVEHVSELRAEKLNRAKVVEKEKNELEGPKNEAMEYLCQENEMAIKRNMLYHKYIVECAEIERKAAAKHEEINNGRKDVLEKLETLANEKKVHIDEHKAITKKYEALAKECEDLKAEFSQYEQKDVRCREDLKLAKAKAKKLEKVIEQERKKLEDLQATPAKVKSEIEELQKRLEKLQTDKQKEEERLKVVMDSLKTETKGLQEEKDVKEKELLALQKSVNETKSKYQIAQSELDLCLSNHQHERAKLQEIQANLTKVTNQLKEATNAVKELNKMIPQTEASYQKDKAELEELRVKETKLNEQVRRAKMRTEETRSSFQANKSRGKVFDAILNLKKSGKVPGIYGRLGDLGAIDEKYDVAISTACGALDNIVVDSIATAQTCVEFLKKNDIGIATFIGLDKMTKWRDVCRQTIETPEKVPRLYDLVRVQDETVLPAFYYALQNTLVANDLEQATRIAYGRSRFRVVTLIGELIEQSGTMSGGGKNVCKGRMGKSVVMDINPNEIQDLEKQLEADIKELQLCRDRRVTLEESTERQQKDLDNMKHVLDKQRMLVAKLEEQEPVLNQQLKEQEKKAKDAEPDDKEVKRLEKIVASSKKEFENSQAKSSSVEEEVQKLHKQIMDIGGSKLKVAQQRVDTVNGQIDLVTGEITKLNVSIKTAQRNASKTEEKIQSTDEEIKANSEAIQALEVEFKQLEIDALKVLEKSKKSQEVKQEFEEALTKIKKKLTTIEEEEQLLQKDDVEVRHELEKYNIIMKENQNKIKLWKKEVSKLKLHDIEGQPQSSLQTYDTDALQNVDTEKMQYEITVIEEHLNQMKPNMAAIQEYKRKEEQYLKRVEELDRITELRDQQRQLHDDYRKLRLNEFMDGFGIITHKLKEMYRMITLGGDAELELVDSLDPFSEGIVFSVRPPKKSWKNISNLSGGEKTLSSLALVFALHHFKPTPLYVMDEIDAALDFKNVSIVANYIKERTKNAQFIIISLRSNMFELADRLIGIYKTHDCTKSVVINPNNIRLTAISQTNETQIINNGTTITNGV